MEGAKEQGVPDVEIRGVAMGYSHMSTTLAPLAATLLLTDDASAAASFAAVSLQQKKQSNCRFQRQILAADRRSKVHSYRS